MSTDQVASEIPGERIDAVVVGAGLAGLSCARALGEAGRSVVVVEASDGVGGRVRSDMVEGYRLDRGFQVVLTAYPELRRQFDVDALDLRPFAPGAKVRTRGEFHTLADPFRQPFTAAKALFAPVGGWRDKLRVGGLRRRLVSDSAPSLLRGADRTTGQALRDAGFSERMINTFFRPLVAGIQLDPSLETSSRMFDVIFQSLATGHAAVPAAGMGAIPDQLVRTLPRDSVLLDTPVAAAESGRVRLSDGRTIDADAVVVATEGPAASRLLGLPPVESQSVTCVWFAAAAAPDDTTAIVLNGTNVGPALNAAIISNVAPEYAPAGKALIVAACPGVVDPDIERDVRQQLKAWWGPDVDEWRHLRTDVIEHGQPGQKPPFSPKRRVSLGDGLFVCGDHRDTASIQGALFSGRRCAKAVIEAGG